MNPLGGLMDAPLPALSETEVLDHVADIRVATVDARPIECLVEHPAGRPDERVTLAILAVARLLADEHQPRPGTSLSHHRLGGVLVQLAGAAVLDRITQGCQRRPSGYRRKGLLVEQAHRRGVPAR
jgi:hypothetical protein